MPFLASLAARRHPGGLGSTLWRFYNRVARSHFPAADIALSILGVPLFVLAADPQFPAATASEKSVAWKGRSYKVRR